MYQITNQDLSRASEYIKSHLLCSSTKNRVIYAISIYSCIASDTIKLMTLYHLH